MRYIYLSSEKRYFFSKLRLQRTNRDGSVFNFSEKLSADGSNIFESAYREFQTDKYSASLNRDQRFQQFVYLFDNYLRQLLWNGSYASTYWVEEYLVHAFAPLCRTPAIVGILADEADRKSCFSDAFLDFLKKVGDSSFQFETQIAMSSFFYEIFYRKCVDQRRKNTAKKNSPNHTWINEDDEQMRLLSENACQTVKDAGFPIEMETLNRAIAALGEPCRQLIQWFYLEEYTLDEISRRINNTPAYVKTTKWRCIEKLRKIVGAKSGNYGG